MLSCKTPLRKGTVIERFSQKSLRGASKRCEPTVIEPIPLLASPQGGGGCVINKISRSHRSNAAGVVFLFVLIRKTTPASLSADASRHFIYCSATPPCGDARRGIKPARRRFVHTFPAHGSIQECSRPLIKANIALLRGVGTPVFSPHFTIAPFMKSTSVCRRAITSCNMLALCLPGAAAPFCTS